MKNWLSSTINVPFHVLKDYELPEFAGKNDLVLAVSCSGDTEEVLKVVGFAYRKDCQIEAISSGGKLEKYCRENNIPFTQIKKLSVPRASFPYLFYASVINLKKRNIISKVESQLASSVSNIKNLQSKISVHTPIEKNPAKKLASKIYDGTPIIYASTINKEIAARFQASLNENAKMLAHTAILPELTHNEIEIWTKNTSKLLKPVLIRNRKESPKIAKRFKIIKQIIEETGFKVNEVWETGNNHLNRLLRSIYLLDYTTIYTAILRKEDPSKTPNTEKVKRKMHRQIPSPQITQLETIRA